VPTSKEGRGKLAPLAALGLIALAIGSGQAYLTGSVADRYDPYQFDLVAMAAEAGSGDIVILDHHSATVIRFLDGGQRSSRPARHSPPPRPMPGGWHLPADVDGRHQFPGRKYCQA
jgi:hypothetical protein